MFLETGLKCFKPTSRKTKWVILLALCGVSSYGMYKVYNLPSVSRKRKRLVKLLVALIAIVQTIPESLEILGVISNDLKQFLSSDQLQIPNSLNQLSKIAESDEFSISLTKVLEAATLGVIQGCNSCKEEQKFENPGVNFKDRVIDRLMSKSGTGFVSVVVGSFARNLVLGFYSNGKFDSGLKVSGDLRDLVDVLSKDESKVVMGDLIVKFISTAVAVYLDRSTRLSSYDGMFCGMKNPKHEKHVKDIVVYVCNGAVETLIKTSHQVLTT